MKLKQFTAVLLIVCMMATLMPTAFATTQNFKDFPTGWSKEAMTAAVSNGLLVGVNATEIRPTANLTRAELATIVVRAFGAKTTANISAFTDVPSNAWYYDYISKAVKMEALVGKSESTMEPLQPITREEVFTALARILVLESDNSSVLSKFKDSGKVSDWAVKSVSALVEKGYVNGDDLGNLNPKANITREEFAQFMHNMIKVYITKPGIYTEDLNGITVLRVGGVTIKNMKQVNDLVAGDGVGFDDVKLEDVEIVGRLLARGGEFTLKRTTVSENVVVKNVNGVVHFNNYRDEAVFSDINEITKATFLSRSTGASGGSTPSVTEKITIKFVADGVEVDSVEIKKGGKFTTLPEIPNKTGYTALGWFDGETQIKVGDTVPSSDTTLVAKYEINKHTVTFKLDNGDADIVKPNIEFGTSILSIAPKYPDDFKKDDWSFIGWEPAVDSNTVLGDAPETYTAKWSQTHAVYTVKHIREALDGTYDENDSELTYIEQPKGEIGKKTDAKAEPYEGFTALPFEQVDVTDDGEAVVVIKYKRNTHTVTFKLDNGDIDVVEENVKFGTPLADILPSGFTKKNYEFAGWNPAIADGATLGDADITYTAQWNKTHSDYVVKHIREDLNGNYDENNSELFDKEELNGKIGDNADITAKPYEGFTAVFDQVTIPETDDLVVIVKYVRKTYDVTFDLNGGITPDGKTHIVVSDVKYGTFIETIEPSDFEKHEHGFIGWDPEITPNTTLGDGDATYIAQWSQTHAMYTVKHIRETLDGRYDENVADLYFEETLKGEIGQKTEATVKEEYEGFTALPFEQVDILANGQAVVIIKYKRNTHTVTFKLDNGEADVVKNDVKYGTFINTIAPTGFEKTDYEFAGWNPEITANTILGDDDAVYTAQWTQTQVGFIIKFIFEALDASGEPQIVTINQTGLAGKEITVQARAEEGFTPDATEKNVTIKEDGTTVIEFYYTRNKHTVTFKLDNGDPDVVEENVKFGTPLADILPAGFEKHNYEFTGWLPAVDANTTLGDADITYTAQWNKTHSDYVVKHIREDLNGNYDENNSELFEEETLNGKIGDNADITAKPYEGFTAETLVQVTIPETDDLVITVKYTRNTYDVTFDLNGGVTADGETQIVVPGVKYGASIMPLAPEGFTKTDWSFVGWDPEIDSNTVLGDEAATYTAQWSQTHAMYTVKHIRETLDGTYDENVADLYFEETLKGEIGQKTEATVKEEYEGFTALSFEQVDVLADGTAVVTIKYERNKYDVTFVLDNGEEDIVVSNVKFGASIEPLVPTDFEKQGSVFDGWDPEITADTVMPDEAVTYTALWVPEKVTVRFVAGKYNNPSTVFTELELDYGTKVEKDVIDAQPVFSTNKYSYKKKSTYAPFYNNETLRTYSDYWYVNDEGKWEQFDENVVVKRDIDVYAWYNYLRIQLTVPKLTSFSPPLLVTYTPDQTRIMDTAKDLLYGANNIWFLNLINEDKYLELRDKAFEKAAKTGVIDEFGQIKITEFPVKITSVIKPEEIHKEVKAYIRDIITHEDKLEQIFSMVSPAELVALIGTEELLGMLSDAQIADIITNQMDRDHLIDLIIDYPEVQAIVVSYLKQLIKPDDEGNVQNITLRDAVIEQIEHQLALDANLRAHILGDAELLDSILTSFEEEIEHRAVYDDEFIATILSEDSIRVSMIEKLLANDEFIELLKDNETLKEHLLDTIRGSISDDIIAMLDPDTGNEDFKNAILDEIKADSELLGSLNSSMGDSIFNAMGTFGTSADIKAYVLHIANERYGIDLSYDGDYSTVISGTDINNMIDDMESEIRAEYPFVSDDDVQATVLQTLNDSWDNIFGDVSDDSSIAYKVDEYKNGAIDAFVNNNGDLTGTDYEPVQSMIDKAILSFVSDFVSGVTFDEEIEDKIATIMMEFAMQDVDSVSNDEIKDLLTNAQNAFKQKAKELDADVIVDTFISYRDASDDNVLVVEQAVTDNYADIIAYVEANMTDTEGQVYKTVDHLLSENAEKVSTDTMARLLNILLEDDDQMITDYFEDFVNNDDNRPIVREQVDAYIKEGNVDADFIALHRSEIVDALTNEGIDLSTYVTVDVIKGYVNSLGGETEKIAFADKVYEALEKVDMFKEFMSSFDNELDTFPIHKENTLFAMGIAEAIQSFDYDTIMVLVKERLPDNKFIDKAIDLFGDALLREMYTEAQTDYCQGIIDIVNEIEADKAAGVEPKTYEYSTSITFKANLVEMLKNAYDKATAKAFSVLDKKGINYTSNQYLNYLLTNDYIEEILYDTGMGENGEFTGYDIRSEEEYAEMVVKYAILLDDAVCWYGDTYTEEQIQAVLSAVLNKTFGLHDKLNDLLTEYRATGNLPEQAEKVLNGVEQVNKLFTQYQPQLNKVIDKYLGSALNKHFESSDVLDKDKVQTGLDIMLGTDDPTFTIDYLYELFYRFEDKTQSKLKQLIDSGKLEKAVKKFEETDLVQLVGKFADNSKVTSLAEKAEEIKNSGKVKSAFESVYDLLVLIAEYGIEPFRTDEDVINVRDAYEVTIKGITLKIARELNS